jgi:hypothetical protein
VTIRSESIQQYIGQSLFDDSGTKIGKIGALFLDDVTGQPAWVTVATGFFGTNESFVPVAGATARDEGLAVPLSRDQIKGAPNVDLEHGRLSAEQEATLYTYYGMRYTPASTDPVIDPGPDLGEPGQSNIGRTDLIQRDADYDDSDTTGMSAGPTNRRGTATDPDADPEARTRLRRWIEADSH